MRKNIALVFLLCLGSFSNLFAQNFADSIRAFPGAEGYGSWITGGRGGRVVYVTHTGDVEDPNNPLYEGSFRAALKTPGNDPITIMFKCGGAIILKPTTGNRLLELKCSRSNMTIVGQTALGDGICIGGHGVQFSGDNIIIRHMRFRIGDATVQNNPALSFANGGTFMVDHCSFSWSVEENINFDDIKGVSMQYCINSESLYNAGHDKGARSYAATIGGDKASYHHNLFAHHVTRMPRANATSTPVTKMFDYRNNVHYNWHKRNSFYGGEVEAPRPCMTQNNIIGNYYKPGPLTAEGNFYFCAPSGGRSQIVGPDPWRYGHGQWWLEGNVMEGDNAKTANNFLGLYADTQGDKYNAASIFGIPAEYAITPQTAADAYEDVLANAGATLPKRDGHDERVVQNTRTKTSPYHGAFNNNRETGIIDSHNNLKPADADASWDAWGSYYAQVDSTQAPLDSDGDGMPDWWEELKGFDPLNPADGNDRDDNDYTNLENYLNRDGLNIVNPKIRQTITWAQDSMSAFGEPNILLAATTNGNLPITYTSNNNAVLSVVNGNELEIAWVGEATITATQAGNAEYARARPFSKVFTVLDFRPDPPTPDPDPTGVGQNAQIPVKVYPNPVESLLNLSLEEEGAYDVKLTDMNGALVYRTRVNGGRQVIDVSSYASGTYLLSVENAQKKRSVVQIVVK